MIVTVSMKSDEDNFRVNDWWASAPMFVVTALQAQLDAARAIWPEELRAWRITDEKPPPERAPK